MHFCCANCRSRLTHRDYFPIVCSLPVLCWPISQLTGVPWDTLVLFITSKFWETWGFSSFSNCYSAVKCTSLPLLLQLNYLLLFKPSSFMIAWFLAHFIITLGINVLLTEGWCNLYWFMVASLPLWLFF